MTARSRKLSRAEALPLSSGPHWASSSSLFDEVSDDVSRSMGAGHVRRLSRRRIEDIAPDWQWA